MWLRGRPAWCPGVWLTVLPPDVGVDDLAPSEPKTASDVWGIVVQAFTGSGELPLEFRLAIIGLIGVAGVAVLAMLWAIWWTSPKRTWNDDAGDPLPEPETPVAANTGGPFCLTMLVAASGLIGVSPAAASVSGPAPTEPAETTPAAGAASGGWFAPPPVRQIDTIGD